MSAPFKISLLDLGGGLSDGLPPSMIEENEFARLENFHPFGKKLRSRDGGERITVTPYGERLTSLFRFKRGTADWQLIVGTRSGFAKLDRNALVPITVAQNLSMAVSDEPWRFIQYQGEMIAVRRASGMPKRVTTDLIMDAGIPGPVAAPTLADGGAGAKAAGDFYGVFTYYNRDTAAESNPSPVSLKLTLAASHQAAWGNLVPSPNAQVTSRRLYLSVPNNKGRYFFVYQVDDNISTTATENVVQDNYGRAASFDNGLPPTNAELIELWLERAWYSDSTDLFHSELGLPQSVGDYNRIPVYADDGHRIRGLRAWGDRLAVGKTNAMHVVLSAGPRRFELQTLSDKHGLIASDTLQTAEGLLFWYSGENFYRSEGVGAASISSTKIRRILDRIPETMKDRAVAAVYPRLSWYVVAVAVDGSTSNNLLLAYNYKTGTWTTFKRPNAPAFLSSFLTDTAGHVLYGVTDADNHVYRLDSGGDDWGTPITSIARTKALDYGQPGFRKGVRRIQVLTPKMAETLTVRVYNDETGVVATERTVSLYSDGWKRINLSTMGKLAGLHQIELEYSGRTPLDLEGLVIEGAVFARGSKAL
jgi:hypothetical protein